MTNETETLTPDPVEEKALAPKQKSDAELVRMTSSGIMVENLNDLLRFADTIVRDGAAPKGWGSGQVAIAVQAGLERGLGLLGGLTQGVVINGVFSWRGQAAVALIQTSGVCKPGTLRFGCDGDGDELVGYAEGHRVGYASRDRREFSVKDARLANLWDKSGPWQSYPKRMLAWRALGMLARDIFPDVLGGFALAEEQVDFDKGDRKRSTSPDVRPELSPPPSADPLMDAIAGKPDVVEAELVPDVPAPPTEAEQPSLLDPEDTCDHGIVLSESCVDCSDQEAALADEKAETQ